MGLTSTPTQRTRVVSIIDRLSISGATKHAIWVTAGLDPDQFEAVLITGSLAKGESDMTYYARKAGLEPIVIKEMSREVSPRDIIVVAKLLRYFWKLKPQIIDTQKAKAGATGRIAALIYKWLTPSGLWLRPRDCRVVHTYHGHVFHSYFSPAKTRVFLAIERALARFCTNAIITISEQQRREISEHFRVGTPKQVRVIPLGIDLDELGKDSVSFRRVYGIENDEFAIGIVGRLCEVKNHSMFLKAAAEFIKDQSSRRIRFIVIGDGHLRAELEQLSAELGISGRVIFTGFRKDAASLYAALDLVVLTSLNEGTPMTLIEAMCAGRPVVATEVGGIVDIMGERQSSADGFSIWQHGLTTPSQDVQTFARALRYLVERPALRQRMGEQGQRFVRTRLSKQRLVTDIEQLYHELTGRRSSNLNQPRSLQRPLRDEAIVEPSS